MAWSNNAPKSLGRSALVIQPYLAEFGRTWSLFWLNLAVFGLKKPVLFRRLLRKVSFLPEFREKCVFRKSEKVREEIGAVSVRLVFS